MDPDKIKGDVHQPYKPQEDPKSSDKIDPKKFKKVMKVDESEESQKRKKRNLPREEEEGEDEPAVEEPQIPSEFFSEFMSDKEELDSIFYKESGGVRRQAATQEDAFVAPPEESISTEGVEVNEIRPSSPPAQSPSNDPSQSNNQSPAPQTPPETSSNAPSQTPPTSESEQQPSGNLPQFQGEFESQAPYQQQQQEPTSQKSSSPEDTDQSNSTQQPQMLTKKEQSHQEQMPEKKEEDSSLLASQPKKSELDALKKKPKTGPAAEIQTVPQEKGPTDKKTPIQQDVIDKPAAFLHTVSPNSSKEKLPQAQTKEPPEEKIESKDPDAKILPVDEAFSGKSSKEKSSDETRKEKPLPTTEKAKQLGPFQRFTSQEVRNQKVGKEVTTTATYEGLTVPTSTESEQGEMGGQHKKKDDQTYTEATSETAGIPLPNFDVPGPSITPTTETTAYSKLSPEMNELFEKIGGVILVQQDRGVTTTTVNINMPNSVFNETQVILDQYSTAPNSYNIQLVGNPESVKVFSQNLDALNASFKQANFNFEVNIQNPILTRGKKSPHLIRRKGNGSNKKEK